MLDTIVLQIPDSMYLFNISSTLAVMCRVMWHISLQYSIHIGENIFQYHLTHLFQIIKASFSHENVSYLF